MKGVGHLAPPDSQKRQMTDTLAFTCRGPYSNPDVGKAAAVFSPFLQKDPEGLRRTVTYLSLLSKWQDLTSNPVLLVESNSVLFLL